MVVPPHYVPWVNKAAAGTGLPYSVVANQINDESSFNPYAVSPAGAEGIAQFEPSTWSSLGIGGSPFNPDDALRGYTKLMVELLNQFHGSVRNALAAYNAGPGNLAAGYGYADTILSQAGEPQGLTVTPGHGSPAVSGSLTVGQLLTAYNPSTIIRHDFFQLGTFGRRGFDHANGIRRLVGAVRYVTIRGPNG